MRNPPPWGGRIESSVAPAGELAGAVAANDRLFPLVKLVDGLLAATAHHGRAALPAIVRRGITFAERARTPKGRLCPYDENPRMPDLRCATVPPDEYRLHYFCHAQA